LRSTRAYSRRLGLIAAAIVFTALNLRTAIASVPPLLDEIRADVPLSVAASSPCSRRCSPPASAPRAGGR
jgi:cyanate permease